MPRRATCSQRWRGSRTSTSHSIRSFAISRSRSISARPRSRARCRRSRRTTRSFYRVTGPRFITVVPDTAAKRQEYEEEVVRTFPLSNADLKETVDLLRIVIDARRLAPVTATNTIAIKDTPARVAAAGKLIAAIDKARPEVVIDVELLEIDRTRIEGIRSADRVAFGQQHDWPDGHRRPGRTSIARTSRCATCAT